MEEDLKLSKKLESFKNTYEAVGELRTAKNGAENLSTGEIKAISDQLTEAISKYRDSGSDKTIDSIVSNTSLVKDGVERIKQHIDSDIPALIEKTNEIYKAILDLEETIKNCKNAEKEYEEELKKTVTVTVESSESNSDSSNKDSNSSSENESDDSSKGSETEKTTKTKSRKSKTIRKRYKTI